MSPEKKPRNGERKQEPSPRKQECTVPWKLICKDKERPIFSSSALSEFFLNQALLPVNFHLITSVHRRKGTEHCKHQQQHCMATHAAGAGTQHS